MEADYQISLITNNLHLNQCTMEADNKVSLTTNYLHLSL